MKRQRRRKQETIVVRLRDSFNGFIEWVRDIGFLTAIALILYLTVCVLLAVVASPAVLLFYGIRYALQLPSCIRESLRRECPVHRVRFQFETFTVDENTAWFNKRLRQIRKYDNHNECRLAPPSLPCEICREAEADKMYPYARSHHNFGKGRHRVWFCPNCRKAHEAFLEEHNRQASEMLGQVWARLILHDHEKQENHRLTVSTDESALAELADLERRLQADGFIIPATRREEEENGQAAT
jgi:hypothetical protein